MAFVQAKADALKASAALIKTIQDSKASEVKVFEDMLKANVGEQEFFHKVSESAADVDGYVEYDGIAWGFFRGPLPHPYEAGWHFIRASFKSKPSDFGNSKLYKDAEAEKILVGSNEDKEFAISHFDAFLDAFKADIDKKLAKDTSV